MKFIFNRNGGLPKTWIGVRINDKLSYRLSIDYQFINAVLNDYPAMGDLQKTPEFLREIALEIAAERLLDRIDQQCCSKSALTALENDEMSEDNDCTLNFEIIGKQDKKRFYGAVSTNPDGMAWILEQLDQIPEPCVKYRSEIPVYLSCEAGGTKMPLQELSELAPHDIVLMDSDLCLNRPEITIGYASEPAFRGTVDVQTGRIIVEKNIVSNMEKNMEKEIPSENAKDRDTVDAAIGEIPVQLVFQLGETRTTVAELSRIRPGYTFDAEADLTKPVTIKANGRIIGMGELVEVGDRIGVRVLQFNDQFTAVVDR